MLEVINAGIFFCWSHILPLSRCTLPWFSSCKWIPCFGPLGFISESWVTCFSRVRHQHLEVQPCAIIFWRKNLRSTKIGQVTWLSFPKIEHRPCFNLQIQIGYVRIQALGKEIHVFTLKISSQNINSCGASERLVWKVSSESAMSRTVYIYIYTHTMLLITRSRYFGPWYAVHSQVVWMLRLSVLFVSRLGSFSPFSQCHCKFMVNCSSSSVYRLVHRSCCRADLRIQGWMR